MRALFKWSFRLVLLAILALGLLIAQTVWFKPLSINWFYERVFFAFGAKNPEMLSSMRILPSWMDWYSDDLSDASLAFEDEMRAQMKTDLATLRSYDRDSLDAEGKLEDWSDDWEDPSFTPVMVRIRLRMRPEALVDWPDMEIPLVLDAGAARQSARGPTFDSLPVPPSVPVQAPGGARKGE